ncbi:MAG: coxB [Caulobacteraceae bacterium]|nr:coxB [Caulobacteraceae bacterium]
MGMRKRASGAVLAFATAMIAGGALAQPIVGQPVDGAIGFQTAYAPLKHDVIFFHDMILLPIITAITLFVAGLLLWCVFRYNKKSNPTPARWSHNTMVEVIWTAMPVLILMFISIFSFKLLFAYHDMPKADMTVKVTGYQWYWGYAYPDQKIDEITSSVMPEAEAKAKGLPFRLAAHDPMVVPVNKVVRVLVTGADVIHAFAMPAFGNKIDAIPGRINQTWFKAEKIGTYYGQCSELCGIDHAFMPIQINVVSQADFDAWAASKAPKPAVATPAALSAPGPAPTGAVPATPAPGADVNPAAPPKPAPPVGPKAAATKTSAPTRIAAPSVKLAALN